MRIRINKNPFSNFHQYPKLEPKKVFPQFIGKIDYEIGFGLSTFLPQHAQTHPDRLVVGIEVLTRAVAQMKELCKEAHLENTYILPGNGATALKEIFDDASIDNIFIFHPTPWIKRRHLKRRVINNDFLLIAEKKLKPGGRIYVSTDVEEMWQQISLTFENNHNFTPIDDTNFWQNFYSTRWHKLSIEQNRQLFFGVFSKKI
jgi:tRNA (guanine-N(7)-)-methyltransferase